MNKLTTSTQRVMIEDALKHIYLCEQEDCQPTTRSVAGMLQITLDEAVDLIAKLAIRKLLRLENGTLRLTATGQEYAVQIVRAHRLWERYLADRTGFTQTEWHDLADQHEHTLSPAETQVLSAKLGHPTHDPHGDPIPTVDGEVVTHGGQPLTSMGSGESGRIVHLEDEPALVYAQLIAEGLYVGMDVYMLETSSQRIRFRAAGEEHVLGPGGSRQHIRFALTRRAKRRNHLHRASGSSKAGAKGPSDKYFAAVSWPGTSPFDGFRNITWYCDCG